MAISLKERFHFTKLSTLLFVGFITSISASLLTGTWSLYFNSFFNDTILVGYFSSILSVVALIMFFILIPVIEKYQEHKLYKFALIFSIILLLILALNKNFYFFVVLIVIYVMMAVLRAESFGIMVRDESKNKSIGKSEGLSFSLSNLGWVIGALLIVPILKFYNYSNVFIFASFFILIGFVIFLFYKRKIKKANPEFNLLNDIKNFFSNKELKKLYLSSLGLSLWLGFVFIYIPLYIVGNEFDKSFVGIFLFAFLLPFLLQYLVGKKSDLIGSKFFIILGYLIMAVFTVLAFFVQHINYVLLFFVFGAFGASFSELTKEIHFFKSIKKKEEERYYGIFLTHIEAGLLIGKIMPAILLNYINFKEVFLIIGIVMFGFLFYSMKLKDF